MAAQLDSANGALVDAAVDRDEARREAAAAAASQSDTERRLTRSEASLAAANDLAAALRRQADEADGMSMQHCKQGHAITGDHRRKLRSDVYC